MPSAGRRTSISGELVIVFIGILCVGLGFSRFMIDNLIYDQTLPITNLTQIVLTPSVKVGATFRYVARFDKREGCKVTQGGYSIAGKANNGDVITLQNFSTATYGTWPPGQRKTAVSGVGMPKSLPPGKYSIWWRYCWTCKGARGVLCVPSDDPSPTSMTVHIIQ